MKWLSSSLNLDLIKKFCSNVTIKLYDKNITKEQIYGKQLNNWKIRLPNVNIFQDELIIDYYYCLFVLYCLYVLYGLSTFVGYLMPNPFYTNKQF